MDDAPLLFHTGPRALFDFVHEAVDSVIPSARLRYVAFSHVEADECGSLNHWLAAAPHAEPVCGLIAATISIADLADRPPCGLADGAVLDLGQHRVRWIDAPHVPHAWDCGYLVEDTTRTLLCGDLFTQGGAKLPAVTTSDILGPSEAFRQGMDYFSHTSRVRPLLETLAGQEPTTLACMHGSAWQGNGARLLRALADALSV